MTTELTGRLLDLSGEHPIFAALARFVEKLDELRGDLQNAGLASGAGRRSALALVLAAPGDPGIVAAFAHAGLGNELAVLAGHANRLLTLVESPAGGFLLETLADYASGAVEPQPLHWSILNQAGQTPLPGGNLSLGGTLALTLSADRSETAWEYADAPGEFLLKTWAEATLKAAAGVALPFSAGKAAASTTADAAVALGWFHDPADAQRGKSLAQLYAERLAQLPNPFDLQDVAEAFETGDLVGVQARPNGRAKLAVSLTLGVDQQIAQGVQLKAGASFSASVSVESGYELSLRKVRPRSAGMPHDIQLKISRRHRREIANGIGFGVEIDLAGLTAAVRTTLAEKLGLLQAELAAIKPYLSPGTALKTLLATELQGAAARILGTGPAATALAADLDAAINRQDPAAVEAWLADQLAGLLDRGAVLGNDTASKLVDAALALAPAPLQALLNKQGVKAKAKAELTTLVNALRTKAEAAVKGLADPALTALENALTAAGEALSGGASRADKAFAGLRKLAGRIDALAARIVTKLENPLRTRISLDLKLAARDWQESRLAVSGRFTRVDDTTARLYRDLMAGNWQTLVRLFETGMPGFLLDAGDSRIALRAGGENSLDFGLVMFGFGAAVSAKSLFDAEIVVDGNGNVQLLSKGEADIAGSLFGQRKAVAFAHTLALAGQIGASQIDTAGSSIALTAEYRDGKLRRNEAEDFIAGLKPLGVALASAEAIALSASFGNGSNAAINGAISASLKLDGAQVAQLLAIGKACGPTGAMRSVIFHHMVEAVQAVGFNERRLRAVTRVLRFVHDESGDTRQDAPAISHSWLAFITSQRLASPRDFDRWLTTQKRFPHGGEDFFPSDFNSERSDAAAAGRLLVTAAGWPNALFALAGVGDALNLPGLTLPERRDLARARTASFVRLLEPFMSVGGPINEIFDQRVARRSLLLFIALRSALAEQGQAPQLLVSLQPEATGDPLLLAVA